MSVKTYKEAGVDIEAAEEFIRKIKPLIKSTHQPGVLSEIGGFSGLFSLKGLNLAEPVLVSATDGVGTKLLLAELLGKYDTIGQDLVAMCVDDVVVCGAKPLFFLDYIATGQLEAAKMEAFIRGVVKGCQLAECALIGGETAELPGLYEPGKFDVAGFCVGVVDRARIIDGRSCQPGDKVIGLASSGLHSNGYSLVRRLFSPEELSSSLGLELLTPTRIYSPLVLRLREKIELKAIAHITGGGLIDNLPRVVPPGLSIKIKENSWPVPEIFRKIQERGPVAKKEMYRTFNMGIGLAVIVSPEDGPALLDILREWGEIAWEIGELVEGQGQVVLVSS
ncbi:MAG: phosphoribosylformylglycinamidine cyclo-ligase [Candidatus Aminicenantes bacterium]|nr:phosphoribosylformylglycinamidine cyclo-ligase [Candidatus Aminicenantes bacterium]